MNKQEAQFILESYRPGTEDDSDPSFKDALELARKDPELMAWLKESEAFDALISQSLQNITPPEGLKDRILETARSTRPAIEAPAEPKAKKVIWWQSPWLMTMAASFAIMMAITLTVIRPQELEADWSVAKIIDTASSQSAEDMQAVQGYANFKDLRIRLESGDIPVPQTEHLPKDLQKDENTQYGYTAMDWDGLPVGRWTLHDKDGLAYHLYVIDAQYLEDVPVLTEPIYREIQGHAFATWTGGDTLYILEQKGSIATLRNLFKNYDK